MTLPALKRFIGIILVTIAFTQVTNAQLCTGSLGDPVVNLTFGSGSNPGPALAAATTAYQYTTTQCPSDGFYTVANSTSGCFGNTWLTVRDHTGNANGYFMLVNASYQPSDFYLDTVKGLCPNTTFEFAAWILNMLVPGSCNGTGILPNITFNIETTSGAVLQSYNTGDIGTNSFATWKQYGFYFTTPAGVTNVVLRMTNNAPGGCGNDLALDDITFRPCGPLVTASIAANNGTMISLCEGDPTVLAFNSIVSAGYNAPAYQWQVSTDSGATWNNISGATATSYTRQPTAPGVYSYRMNVAEAGNIMLSTCRVASNIISVTINPNPTITATSLGQKCAGASLFLNVVGGTGYSWTGPGGFSSSSQADTITSAATSSSGTYYVTVTSAAGCSKKDSVIVVVYPNPVAKFGTSLPSCENGNIIFTDQSNPSGQTLVKWHWDFGDGDTASAQNPVHVFSSAGTYPIMLTEQTDKGCIGSVTAQALTVHPLPQPNFGTPKVCLTDPFAAFTDSSSIADGSQAQFTWLWDFGDPNATAGDPNSSTLQNPQHTYITVGIYTVKLTVKSKDGCTKDTTRLFTVNGALPVAGFVINNAANLCSNQQVTITDHSTVNFGNITKVEIYWDYQNDPTAKTTDETPAPGKQYNFIYPDFGNPLTKTYQIRYVAYSGISCVNETAQTVTLNASPEVQFDALNPVCQGGASFTVTQARDTSGLSGSGVYSGRGIDAAGLFNPGAVTPGTDSLRYTFTAANGCSAFADQAILVYPQPTADAGPDRTVLEGGYVILNGSGTGNNISYLWLPDSAMDNNHIATPRISPSNDIVYTLIVTSADGCIDSSHVVITVLKKPVVPNAFSPNGDGINDTWVIKYLDSYPAAEVSVFNRYGQLVYHTIGYNRPWDGTYNGRPLPVATYYWIIDPKSGRTQMSGSVTIIR